MPKLSHRPKLLLYALLLSPALILLHACGDKSEGSSDESQAPRSPSTAATPATASSGQPKSPAPLPADPEAAFAALTAANAPQVRKRLRADSQEWNSRLAPFYRAWAELDPEAALQSASAEGRFALAATLAVVKGWTRHDPGQAQAWVAQRESQTLRTRYAGPLIKAWPEHDLAALATWSQDYPSLLPAVTMKWLTTDPPETAQWLGSLPSGPHHRRATEILFRQWAKADPGSAGDYLVAAGEFPNRDAALASYASTVVADDPNAAELWARDISDPDLRARILQALPSLRPLVNSPPGAISEAP